VVKIWLEEHKVDQVPWPANSPDLNIMENFNKLWKERVDNRNPEDKNSLKRFIKEEFYKFTPKDIQNLVKSVPQRLSKIIKAKGGHIGY